MCFCSLSLISIHRYVHKIPSNGTTNSKLSKTKSQNCKCEPSTCKCSSKRRQQQQYQRLILSQLRRRGADNISSVILF
ncbi:uncharacterized protein LOC6641697 isoform X3 [Drosophila willistoni]|uniref:uncharacterized protein LOC6641697 isoform X3 n=1 Tax=Drosophila willistoni TaxID=7260 RepID=UPI001F0753F3|nr:uncharacterized protein LOC6641697 isoform X3 [Drosophila willistoni]